MRCDCSSTLLHHEAFEALNSEFIMKFMHCQPVTGIVAVCQWPWHALAQYCPGLVTSPDPDWIQRQTERSDGPGLAS